MNEDKKSTATPFRALAMDGGGMRGYYSVSLLDTLARRFGVPNTEDFDLGARCDLLCGTSTGGILACGLATGVNLPKIANLYAKHGKEIFPHPKPNDGWRYWRWLFRHRNRPSANADALRSGLAQIFGDMTMEEAYRKREIALCVPAINATTYKAWVFKTPHIPNKTRDCKYKLTDVCMAGAAAPIFFPVHSVLNPDNSRQLQGFVDGGLWANNAVLLALVEALELTEARNESNRDIHIMAVGTASTPNGDPNAPKKPNWGIADWKAGIKMTEMCIAAQAYGYDSIAKFIASALSRNGRTVKIVRLEETQKSPEKYSAIGLDRADDNALDTMIGMAEDDASSIHSKRDSDWYFVVRDFFNNTSERR